MASKSRMQVVEWLRQINLTGEKVLDLGAGNNPAKNYASIKCNVYETMDIDRDCKPKYVYDINEELCCNNLRFFLERYDAVFCIETAEYFWDTYTAFENFNKLLKPGGKLFLSVGFIYPHHGKDDYLRYTDNGLRKLLEKTMFEVDEMFPRIATDGGQDLMRFFSREEMHSHELRHDYREGIPLGYCVEATKKNA